MSKVKVHITAVRLRNRPGPSVDPGCLRPHRVLLTAFMSGNQFLSKQYENQSMSDRDTHAHTRSHTQTRTHTLLHCHSLPDSHLEHSCVYVVDGL